MMKREDKRYSLAVLTGVIGVIGNLFLLIIKGIVGVLSNSQSLLADAFNSAGDIFSSLMTFIGSKISSQVADDDHNLGHGKAEYIYSLFISISMIFLSLTMIKNVIVNFLEKKYFTYSIWLVVVCLVTIVVKFGLFLYTNFLYQKTRNVLIHANSLDHRNDILLTSITLISILGSHKFHYLDFLTGIFISLWILYTSIRLFRESYDVLMDKSMDDATRDKVLKIIERHPEVQRINHFNSTPVGYRYQISFTIFVDGNLSTFQSHDIANSLEREIEKEMDEIYLSVIHVNPILIDEGRSGKKVKKNLKNC